MHSHSLGPIKERIVNLNIDEFNMGCDGRFWLDLDNYARYFNYVPPFLARYRTVVNYFNGFLFFGSMAVGI